MLGAFGANAFSRAQTYSAENAPSRSSQAPRPRAGCIRVERATASSWLGTLPALKTIERRSLASELPLRSLIPHARAGCGGGRFSVSRAGRPDKGGGWTHEKTPGNRAFDGDDHPAPVRRQRRGDTLEELGLLRLPLADRRGHRDSDVPGV